MAFAGLLSLLDDITAILDDVAILSKAAAKKTAGIIGDDLALNAQQVIGSPAQRELPVIAKVAAGSLVNKAILIPSALTISMFAPAWVIPALLTAGGAYLCFEGVEKVMHSMLHKDKHKHDEHQAAEHLKNPHGSKDEEKKKIWGAIRTDFILSAEIVVITLGSVAAAPLLSQALTLSTIGLGMTAFVYGMVAGIVKIDDLGLAMMGKQGDGLFSKSLRGAGLGLIKTAPVLMKGLSILGTAAMFVVGGELLIHNIPAVESVVHHITHGLAHGGLAEFAINTAAGALTGVLAGGAAVAVITPIAKAWNWIKPKKNEKTPVPEKKPEAADVKPEPAAKPAPAQTVKPEVTVKPEAGKAFDAASTAPEAKSNEAPPENAAPAKEKPPKLML